MISKIEIIGQLKRWPGTKSDGDSSGVKDLSIDRIANDDEVNVKKRGPAIVSNVNMIDYLFLFFVF